MPDACGAYLAILAFADSPALSDFPYAAYAGLIGLKGIHVWHAADIARGGGNALSERAAVGARCIGQAGVGLFQGAAQG